MNNDAITLLVWPEAEWYDMGMMFFDDGFDISECPYEEGSEQEAYFIRGYNDAVDEGK